jgi:hypothetical protein
MKFLDIPSAIAYIKQFVRENALRPADVVIVPITRINVAGHHIVYLHDLEFIQNSNNGRNVHRPDLIQLAHDLSLHKWIKRFVGTETERTIAVNRAFRIEREGRVYSWNDYNCEDFSSEVQTGYPRSKQVFNVYGTLGALGIIGLIAGLKTKKNALTGGSAALLIVIFIAAMSRCNYQSSLPPVIAK